MTRESKAKDPFRRERLPLMLVISGPAGVGKDAVVHRLRERDFPFHFVVTATDRAPREGEEQGVDYYFYSTTKFEKMIANGEFLEYARVYGQYKGIPREHVRRALDSGQDVVLRIDVQGVATIKAKVPEAISVFLTCESEDELKYRLLSRGADTEEQIEKRLAKVWHEMTRIRSFDYVVANRNNQIEAAVDDVLAIVRAEHCQAVPQRICL